MPFVRRWRERLTKSFDFFTVDDSQILEKYKKIVKDEFCLRNRIFHGFGIESLILKLALEDETASTLVLILPFSRITHCQTRGKFNLTVDVITTAKIVWMIITIFVCFSGLLSFLAAIWTRYLEKIIIVWAINCSRSFCVQVFCELA